MPTSASAVFLFIVFITIAGLAQRIDQDLRFDPTPLQLPKVHKHLSRVPVPTDFIALRDLHGVQISPDGQRIAFVVGQTDLKSNSYRSALFVVRTDGSELINLGTAGPAHWDTIHEWLPDPPQWSADSKSLYYRYKDSGTWQVWRWTLTGGPPTEVTHVTNDVIGFFLATDGEFLVLTVDAPDSAPTANADAPNGLLYDGTLTGWHGRSITDEAERANRHHETWIHDLRRGAAHQASQQELKRFGVQDENQPQMPSNGRVLNSKLSPNGDFVAYQVYVDDPDHSNFSHYPILVRKLDGDNTAIELSPQGYRVLGEYWWSHNSQALYYVNAENGQPPQLMMIGRGGGSSKQLLGTTDYLDQFSVDNDGHYIALSFENSTVPPEVAVADSTTGISVLVDLNPEFKNLQLSPAKRVEFSTKKGERFHGHLVLPLNYQAGKRYPLIITGYSDNSDFLRGGTGDEYPIQVFAANGFVVLNFSVAHNGLSIKPGDFGTALLRLQSPLEGMSAAISYLAEKGVIDSSRVGITGLSHGAEVLSYAISHSDIFRAAIASGPPGDDPYFFYMAGNAWHDIFGKWGLGGWPEGVSSENWHKISPTLNADRIHTPLLVNAADSEYLVALGLITSLEQLHKPVEMFIYPNELHIKTQPKHREEIYERNVDWFRFWLKDEEDQAPAKAEQYKRWRELRRLQQNEKIQAETR
ncbi:MAG TPA: Atxe2 family lasso peptide isopeptidase [Terriglobales bacterium]|jgi:dipeptidyl aminopeptidase/acylaminoacyl peptidase|nr:Atxe2 family lasso peptide isopeptidase [Terriglobales bacterium]